MKKLIFLLLFLSSFALKAQDTLFVNANTIELSKAGKRIYKGINILYVKKNLPSNIQFGNASSFYELLAPVGNLNVSVNGAAAVANLSYDGIYSAIKNNLTALSSSSSGSSSSTVVVSNFPATQVVSGTITASTGLAQPLTDSQLRASVVAVAPNIARGTGAIDVNTQRVALATDSPGITSLSTIASNTANPPVKLQDGLGVNITSTLINSKNRLDVNLASASTVGATAPATGDMVGGTDGTNFQPLQMDGSKNLKAVISAALPAGTNSIGRVVSSAPTSTSGVITSATTAAGGTTFVAFGSQACTQLYLANNTGVTIEFQIGGSGIGMPVFNGAYYLVTGITNASNVGIRRVDLSTTTVTIQAHALSN
jgi:hypothetical protein